MTLFKPELRAKMLRIEKTQTRRPQGDARLATVLNADNTCTKKLITKNGSGIAKWTTGKTYSVEYGYGKPMAWYYVPTMTELPFYADSRTLKSYQSYRDSNGKPMVNLLRRDGYAPFRYRVLDLRQEDARDISAGDVEAEGFVYAPQFWHVWCGFYDKSALKLLDQYTDYQGVDIIAQIKKDLMTRPDHLYQCNVIDFELVR